MRASLDLDDLTSRVKRYVRIYKWNWPRYCLPFCPLPKLAKFIITPLHIWIKQTVSKIHQIHHHWVVTHRQKSSARAQSYGYVQDHGVIRSIAFLVINSEKQLYQKGRHTTSHMNQQADHLFRKTVFLLHVLFTKKLWSWEGSLFTRPIAHTHC